MGTNTVRSCECKHFIICMLKLSVYITTFKPTYMLITSKLNKLFNKIVKVFDYFFNSNLLNIYTNNLYITKINFKIIIREN